MNRPVRPVKPEPIKRQPTPATDIAPRFTLEKFYNVIFTATGMIKDDVDTILKSMKISKVDGNNYWEVVALLKIHHAKTREAMENPHKSMDRYYEFCPVCGEPTMRDPERDNLFGAAYGWKCTVKADHFMEWRWQHLKSFLTRHQGEPDL